MDYLQKHFVFVPQASAVTVDALLELSKTTKLIYFVEATNEIVARGVAFGASVEDIQRIATLEDSVFGTDELEGLVSIVGTASVKYAEGDEIPEGKEIGDTKEEATGLFARIEDLEAKSIIVDDASADYLELDKDGDTDVLKAKTTALGDAVGLTKVVDEDGNVKWEFADGELAENPGLASAADVAVEIVEDEEVIAAALTDHEERITAIETYDPWEVYSA